MRWADVYGWHTKWHPSQDRGAAVPPLDPPGSIVCERQMGWRRWATEGVDTTQMEVS
jgi:hypothetical protein